MKKGLAAVFIILPIAIAVWILLHPHSAGKRGTAGKSDSEQDAAVASALARTDPNAAAVIESNFAAVQAAAPVAAHAVAGPPATLESTNLEPIVVLDALRVTVRQYGSMFGGNPVGVNSEITSQLNGNNPKQANFIRPEAGMRINAQGELVDPWGTPYFFHQISGTEMEIHSAGPDRKMWTSDDLVTK